MNRAITNRCSGRHAALVVLLCWACGCQGNTTTAVPAQQLSGVSYLLAAEPADPVPVGTARSQAEDGQTLTLIGYIGGTESPFVNGAAVFTIVDPDVPRCADENDPTPWTYCCQQDKLKTNMATIQFVDQDGEILYQDAKQLLGIKEMDLVLVQGTAKRDEAGNLTLAAEKLYVKR